MKKIILALLLFLSVQSFGQTNRFPSIDSLKNYILRYVRNSTMESFTNYRLQNVVYGTAELLDSISASLESNGIDTIYLSSSATKDSIKYTKGGSAYTAAILDKASLKLNITDTSAMLSPYLRTGIAAATYVPYTGANASVNLGAFGLTTDRFVFNQTPTLAGGERIMRWNDTDGTLDVGVKGGNVTLQVGQEQHARARNNTGSTILNGQVVYISGSTGTNTTVALARADALSTSKATIGIATEDISNGQSGFVTTFGKVRDINTSALTEGGLVYLSSTTAGALTSTAPTGDTYPIVIGVCERSHATQGVIFVRIDKEYVRQYDLDTAKANIRTEKLSNITGLVTAGTNVTITGSGTSGSPYVVGTNGVASVISRGTFSQRPASPDTGAIYEQTDRLAGFWRYNGSKWNFQGVIENYLFQDNISIGNAASTLPYSGYNSFSSILISGSGTSSVQPRKGSDYWLKLNSTGGDLTYSLVTSGGDLDKLIIDSVIIWYETEIEIDTLGSAAENIGFTVGYDNSVHDYTNGDRVVFRYNYNVNGGRFETRTVAATTGTWTTKDAGVTVVAGTRYVLAYEVDGYAQKINFYINDVLVTTHSISGGDNVPFPNATTLATSMSNMSFNWDRLAGTNGRSLWINRPVAYYIKRNY